MNYIGSKKKLLPFLEETILKVISNPETKSFADLFSGTTIVASHFKKHFNSIIANDLEYYSYVLGRNYIQNQIVNLSLIDKLNSLSGESGFISQHYAPPARMYFTEQNANKIDAIRQEIEAWYENGDITEDNYYFLLCSLLESADKVANTASVYGAYLKAFKASASKSLILDPALPVFPAKSGKMHNKDILELLTEIEGDVLYLDPPYNGRQYGSNYHMLNTIARYKEFTPKGVTGLPDYNKSDFCSKVKVEKVFKQLLETANFKYIFISYNDEGILPIEKLASICKSIGKYDLYQIDYQRFKADSARKTKQDSTIEFIHVVEKP
jgi:adenine-specific DNA-methyltransferase